MAAGDPGDCPVWVAYVVSLLFVAAIIVVCIFGARYAHDGATKPLLRYYVSIDSASGLDLPPSKDLVLDPRFNLTILLATSNPGRHPVCVEAGTYVMVSYRCVPLATTLAAPHQVCVGGAENNSSMAMSIVASGTGVRLPGYMMDSLVPDMRNGVASFDLRFKLSGNNFYDVASCGFTRVGGGATQCGPLDICPDSEHQTTTSSTPLIY